MTSIKKVLIIVNTYKEEAFVLSERIRAFLSKKKIEVDEFLYSGSDSACQWERYDFAITLGGDGTVLFAARNLAKYHIPIFPINLGEFGFIAGIQKDSWQKSLLEHLNGDLSLTPRTMLRARVFRDNKLFFESTALNDIVVSAKSAAKIICLNIHFNANNFGRFKADGIIVASATGSTAYSAAAGGPIIDPELDAFVLSPICPFSLSNRPIVLPGSGTLNVELLESRHVDAALTIDGQVVMDLQLGDKIQINKAAEQVLLIDCDAKVFYSALRSKLQWSGGPSA